MARVVTSYASLMKEAKKSGVDQNKLFTAAAKTYDQQAKRKAGMEKTIEEEGLTVTKVYVKGQENSMPHPLIDPLQKLEDSMNRTLKTMAELIDMFGRKPEEPDDGLSEFRNDR